MNSIMIELIEYPSASLIFLGLFSWREYYKPFCVNYKEKEDAEIGSIDVYRSKA